MTAIQPGPVEAIATGLMVVDDEGTIVRDERARFGGAVWMPGQRLRVTENDPVVVEQIRSDRLQLVQDLPKPDFFAKDRLLRVEPGEAEPFADAPTASSLRIVSGTGYDPGAAAYRLHNALTEWTPHGTAFVRYMLSNNNPHDCPTQFSMRKQMPLVRALLLEADVVHCHINGLLTHNAGLGNRPRDSQIVIRHYHGTQFGATDHQVPDAQQAPVKNAAADDRAGYVLVGARLQLCALRPGRIHWLPIPVPVQRYSAMRLLQGYRTPTADRPFRVAHSPTRRRLKGTTEFLMACRRLQARGVPIEPVLIENVSHLEALRLKATTDVCFDAFALGLQGSGLEAAAMGQPVIAGDARVRELHEQAVGNCPYTFADNGEQLEQQLERLAMDAEFYAAESNRVSAYTKQYHDYEAVADRYCRILAGAA